MPQKTDAACITRMAETVVKCSLGAALTNVAARPVIEKLVHDLSARWRLGTSNFSLLLTEVFHDAPEGDVSRVQLPPLTATTVRQMLLRTSRSPNRPDVHVQAFYRRHPELEGPLQALPHP